MQPQRPSPEKDKGKQPQRQAPGFPNKPARDRGSERPRQPEPPRRQHHGSGTEPPFEEDDSVDEYPDRPSEQPHHDKF